MAGDGGWYCVAMSSDGGDRITLGDAIERVPGVRAGQARALALLEIVTVADLVRNLPTRYEEVHAETTIDQVRHEQLMTVRGQVSATRVSGFGRKQRFQAVLMDHTGRLDLVWFNAPYMKDRVYPGVRMRVHGKARTFGPGLQLANPKHEILSEDREEPPESESRIRPVYPASERISSAQIEGVVKTVLPVALPLIEEHLPEAYRIKRELPKLSDAYRMSHAPASMEEAREARRRLAFDELLLMQLGVFLRRAQVRASSRAPKLKWNEAIDRHIRERFPFVLTGAQDRVVREIAEGLQRADPSNRLIQGDVGSGKTIVALYAMLMAVASGHQATLMAPTELLAEQHYASISATLKGSNVRVALLTGSADAAHRARVLSGISSGAIEMVVGTHSLLSEHVQFRSLAVAVIDEQHRFGVHQRADLRSKSDDVEIGNAGATGLLTSGGERARQEERKATADGRRVVPHTLVMTATPIPRTLALTLMGDLDVSVIDELPPGRTPIVTKVVEPGQSGDVYTYVRTRLDSGEQAFVVVPAIDTGASSAGAGGETELNDLRTVMARLEAHEFAGKRLAALHGRLSTETRDAVMSRFRAGQIDALIATTVVEVGVDVPNATVMVIEHAERFGLAQLHQLRGRVGRGSKRSLCVLIGDSTMPDAVARLGVMAQTGDGFEIAEKDLEIRGPGEVFGLRQAGAPPLRVANLTLDRELLNLARRDAEAWIERSPTLGKPEENLLRKRLLKAHGKWLGLGDVG